jgi:predicted nucleotidyltransferase component of viral defense system
MKKVSYKNQVELMLKLLPIVSSEKTFALKGGTAINFFIRNLPRLSVDIDLTYLPIEDRTTTGTNITKIFTNISNKIKAKYPYIKIKQTNLVKEKFTNKLIITDQNTQVKVETNYILRGSVFGTKNVTTNKQVFKYYNAEAKMKLLTAEDLYGGKLCAMLDRQHPRDIFDIKILMDNEGITDKIRQAFIVYLASSSRPIAELLDSTKQDISKSFNKSFYGMTFKPITIDMLTFVRDKVIKQINNELTNNERKFLLSIKRGTPDFSLIKIKGIESLPGIKWKLYNISNMPKAKHKKAIEKLRKVLNL